MGTDLGLPLVPPLARRTFSQLVGGWSGTAERWIDTVLQEPECNATKTETTAQTLLATPEAERLGIAAT
jgi:hypothetical protein